jgi:ABC-type Fe3+-hydroxamate transport system substrate-binding protein
MMVAGKDNFIESVLEYAGIRNVFSRTANLKGGTLRYPAISTEDLVQSRPDWILLSSEPYPFKEKHITEVSKYCKKTNIVLVNGEWFSWYGSRMLKAFEQLNVLRRAIA